MKMNKKAFIISFLGAVTMCVSVVIWHKSKDADFSEEENTKRAQIFSQERLEAEEVNDLPLEAVTKKKSVFEEEAADTGEIPEPELIRKFKSMQAKVFKDESDKAYLKRLLSDSKYLQQLSNYLRDAQSIQNPSFRENQNLAIDFILEALNADASASAEQAIFDVIQDSQVEDVQLKLNLREMLAGVKADLLYQASAVKPELIPQIEQVLPGPVSQKIWKNVQKQHAENLASSEIEKQARVASQKRD